MSGYRYNGTILRQMQTRSVTECTYICTLEPGCYAANFRETDQTCAHVSEEDGDQMLNLVSDQVWSVFVVNN